MIPVMTYDYLCREVPTSLKTVHLDEPGWGVGRAPEAHSYSHHTPREGLKHAPHKRGMTTPPNSFDKGCAVLKVGIHGNKDLTSEFCSAHFCQKGDVFSAGHALR